MDSNKLLEILLLIEADETEFTFGAKIDEIISFISQNNEEGNKQAEARLSEIEASIKLSRAAQFSGTETELLKNLSAEAYFGITLFRGLQKILNGKGYAISSGLSKFQTARTAKYGSLIKLKNVMAETGITAYKQQEQEVALTIPDAQAQISEVSDYLLNFGRFIESVQACMTNDTTAFTPPKIVRLNKGTLEFFVNVDPTVAESVLHCLGDLAALYLTVKDIRGKKEDPILTDPEKKEVAEIYEKAAQRKVEEFLTQTVNKIATQATPEQKTTLRTYLKLLLKWIPLGIHLEVVFSKTVTPVSKDANGVNAPAEVKLREGQYNQQIRIADMYKLPLEQLKLPEPNGESNAEKTEKKA